MHVSLGTEAAAQMKLDQFNKETKVEDNKRAIKLLRDADIFTEAQFIVGLDNETPETLEETYQMAWDWQPDLANWAMYTPWPFTPLFQELGDKVEVFDYSKYNFVTPIMKPEVMTRGEVLAGVMKNYRRFYMRRSFFSYPWLKDKYKRKYMMGCLKAFLKSSVERRFYDLGRVGFFGQKDVDFKFDESKVLTEEELRDAEARRPKVGSMYNKPDRDAEPAPVGTASACGGGPATDAQGRALGGPNALPEMNGNGNGKRHADPNSISRQMGLDGAPPPRKPKHQPLDMEALLGEERIDEFLDPRGFARQRARAKRQSALLTTMAEEDVQGRELER